MNKTFFTGRLVKDPDVRFYGDNNDKKSARYVLAVDRGVKRDPNNPEQQTADFINCICYGRAADFADQYLRKGTKILVEGRLQTGKYTNKEGQTVYTTDNVVERHEFCESKSASGQQNQQTQTAPEPAVQASTQVQQSTKTQTEPFINIPDNIQMEVPFS